MLRKIAILLMVPMALAACGEAKEALGIGRITPDEFAVVDRPALEIPPDYALRPPQPGAPRPQEQSAARQAEQAVFGNVAAAPSAAVSSGDLTQDVLARAGANKANPNIRSVIDRESAQRVSGDRHLVEELLWWRKKDPSANAAIVDAAAEKQRLQGNQGAGKPADAGATPIIEKRKSGWLGL